VTGGIGVIISAWMPRADAEGWIQALENHFGERKNMGSLFRPITAEERKLFQGIIDSLFARFADTVAEEGSFPAKR